MLYTAIICNNNVIPFKYGHKYENKPQVVINLKYYLMYRQIYIIYYIYIE